MDMARVKKMLPGCGGWLYVMLSAPGGSLGSMALSIVMRMIEPVIWRLHT